MSLFSLHGFTQQEQIVTSIRHMCMGDVRLARLFLECLEDGEAARILESLLASKTPKIFAPSFGVRSEAHLRWVEAQLLRHYGTCDAAAGNGAWFIERELVMSKHKLVVAFLHALNEHKRIPQSDLGLANFAVATVNLMRLRPSMSEYLRLHYGSMFRSLTLSKLMENLHFASFDLFPSIDSDSRLESRRFVYTSARDFEELFMIEQGWKTGKVLKVIQNQIVEDCAYPHFMTYEVDREMRSVLSTSIVKNIHFADLLALPSRVVFRKGEYKMSLAHRHLFPEIWPWIFVSNSKDFVSEFYRIGDVGLDLSTDKSIIGDLHRRLGNDKKFLSDLRMHTGDKVSVEDITEHSYPWMMKYCLQNVNPTPFETFHETPLFCISDVDRVCDANFIWAALALFTLVVAIDGKGTGESLDQVEWYLEQIRGATNGGDDGSFLQNVLRDVFSLVFLRRDGRLICEKYIAERVLLIIMDMADDPELVACAQAGHNRLSVDGMIHQNGTIEDASVSRAQHLFEALERHEWQIAEDFAYVREQDLRFVKVFRSVYDAVTSKAVGDDIIPHAAAEITLVLDASLEMLDKALLAEVSNEAIHLLRARKDATGRDPMVIGSKRCHGIGAISGKLTDLGKKEWQVPSMAKTQTDLTAMYSFMSYLDLLLPALLAAGLASTVYEALKLNPRNALEGLVRSGNTKEASKLVDVGKSMVEMILQDGTCSPEVVGHVTKEYPVVSVAAFCMHRKVNCTSDIPGDSPCGRLLKRIRVKGSKGDSMDKTMRSGMAPVSYPKTESLSSDVAFEVLPGGISDAEAWKMIPTLFSEGKLDDVCDLSFVVDVAVFSEFLWDRLENDNVDTIVKLANMCALTAEMSDIFHFLASVKDCGIVVFPLTDALTDLIRHNKFRMASEFVTKLSDKIDAFDVLSACLRVHADKISVISVAPKLRQRLVEVVYIPGMSVDSVTSDEVQDQMMVICREHMCSDLPCVVDILLKSPGLNCDEMFIQSLERFSSKPSIRKFGSRVQTYLPVCRNLDVFVTGISAAFERIVDRFEIGSGDSEDALLDGVTRMHEALEPLKDRVFTKKTRVLQSILERGPNMFRKFRYSMKGFGVELLPFCLELDLVDEFKMMVELWNITQDEKENLLDKYFTKCFGISVVDNLAEFPKRKHVFRVIAYRLGYAQFFTSPNMNDASDVAHYNDTYPRVCDIASKGQTGSAGAMPLWFEEHAPTDIIILCYSLRGDLEQAMSYVRRITNDEEREKVFRQNVMEVAVSHDVFSELAVHIKGDDVLLRSVRANAGPHLLFHIEMQTGMYRDACTTAISLFQASRRTLQALKYLDMAKQALELEPSRTDDDIRLLVDINLQSLFNELVKEGRLDGFSEMNLFGESRFKLSMVLLLFLRGDFDLSVTLINTYDLDTCKIGEMTADAILNEGDEIISVFVSCLESTCVRNEFMSMFKEIMYSIIMRFVFEIGRDDLGIILTNRLSDLEFRARILIQFGLLKEAADLIVQHDLISLVPLVLRGSRDTRTPWVSACEKLLQRASQEK